MRALAILIGCISLFSSIESNGQFDYVVPDSSSLIISDAHCAKFQKRSVNRIEKLTARIKKANDHYLEDFIKRQNALLESLCTINELGAEAMMQDALYSHKRFENTCDREKNYEPGLYRPEIDTLTLAVSFLDSKSNGEGGNCLCPHLKSVKAASENLKLELKRSELITNYIQERTNYLTRTLADTPFAQFQMNSISHSLHYYKAQIAEFNAIFADRSKIENLIFSKLLANSQFSAFVNAQGQLALPNTVNATPAKLSISQLLAEAPKATTDITSAILSKSDVNRVEIKELVTDAGTDMLSGLDSLGSKSLDLVEDTERDSLSTKGHVQNEIVKKNKEKVWKPNPLKTKRFIDRLNWGLNFQADRRNNLFPLSGTLAINTSYQVHRNANIGMASSYIIGFSRYVPFTNEQIPVIRSFQSNGINFRSFIDFKLRGAIYFQCNLEKNYRKGSYTSRDYSLFDLRSYDFQSTSFLGGLKIKYPSSNKLSKPTLEILYDFLSPKNGQPALVFRVGVEFSRKHSLR